MTPRTMFWAPVVLAALIFGGCQRFILPVDPTPPGKPPANGTELQFETVAKGDGGWSEELQEKRYLVIDDEQEWARVWGQMHASVMPQPALPQIDFTQHTVIAVFMGMRGSGGFEIHVDRLVDIGDVVDASIVEVSPGPGCFVTEALTTPYHVVVTNRKVHEQVRFNTSEVRTTCEELPEELLR